MEINKISEIVIGCALKVHSVLGPGLLENVYEICLYEELKSTGLKIERQKYLPVVYKDIKLDASFRIDLMIEDQLIVELKAVETIHPIFMAQIMTYLKLSKCKIGLLINFNEKWLKDGIKRVIFDH
ncbi:MAG: GxxExxY protein [Bacteroidia bacterium]